MKRLHMRNDVQMVEWPDTPTGRMQAKAFRRSHSEFKRRRIREVLQLLPSEVPCGVPMNWT